MPSKRRHLRYLGFRLLGWLVWLPFTGNPWHGRTYGQFKRLGAKRAAVLLAPLACYVGIAAWVYVYFPRELVPLAGSVYATGLFLGGTLVASTLVATGLLEATSNEANQSRYGSQTRRTPSSKLIWGSQPVAS